MSLSRPYLITYILLSFAFCIAILMLAAPMAPLHSDTPANFWFAATAVDLGATRHRQDVFVFDRDRFVYSSQYSFHAYPDYPYQTLSLKDAERDFPAVCAALAVRAANSDPADYVAQAYARWRTDTRSAGTPCELLDAIHQARVIYFTSTATPPVAPTLYIEFHRGLLHVARADRRYWATILFELLLFPGMLAFLFYPFIRRFSLTRKAMHIASFPFLLFLPNWLGYCNSASPAFPIGGILYPYLMVPVPPFSASSPFAVGNYNWEYHFLAHLPPILLPFTQGRAPSYADLPAWRVSIPYQWTPVNTAALSLLLTITYSLFPASRWLFRRLSRPPRGFPVNCDPPLKQDNLNR